MKANIKSVGFNTVIFVIVVAQIVGLLTHEWSLPPSPYKGASRGLWKVCSPDKICKDIDNIPDNAINSMYAIRTLAFIGTLLTSLGFLSVLTHRHEKYHVTLIIIGGLLSIISAIVYATDKNVFSSVETLGYSWYLTVISGALAVIIGLADYQAHGGKFPKFKL